MKVYVFAGPNGSGKSTVVSQKIDAEGFPDFISPDTVAQTHPECIAIDGYREKNLRAAELAEELRLEYVDKGMPFAFETVLSTINKLDFLKDIKKMGYEVNSIYITTSDPMINIKRVAKRVAEGGHDVPEDKIVSRYHKNMKLMHEVILISNNAQVFDNTFEDVNPILVYQKMNDYHGIMSTEYQPDYLYEHIINPLKELGLIDESIKEFDGEEDGNFELYGNLASIYSKSRLDILKLTVAEAKLVLDKTYEEDRVLTTIEVEELLNINDQ